MQPKVKITQKGHSRTIKTALRPFAMLKEVKRTIADLHLVISITKCIGSRVGTYLTPPPDLMKTYGEVYVLDNTAKRPLQWQKKKEINVSAISSLAEK